MPTGILILVITYFVVMNILGFASMGIDKAKAKKHAWRTPEATLFAIALLGGSFGSFMGMHHFRHKTKHWYFAIGIPAICFLQLAAAGLIYRSF